MVDAVGVAAHPGARIGPRIALPNRILGRARIVPRLSMAPHLLRKPFCSGRRSRTSSPALSVTSPAICYIGRRSFVFRCGMEDTVFSICGSCRAAPIVCEHVPGSVAKRYRSIKFVSAAALVEEFNDQWFVDFVPNKSGVSNEIVLTITGGSQVPEQPEVVTHGTASSRGNARGDPSDHQDAHGAVLRRVSSVCTKRPRHFHHDLGV